MFGANDHLATAAADAREQGDDAHEDHATAHHRLAMTRPDAQPGAKPDDWSDLSQVWTAPEAASPAFIPADYMPEARLRITAYRELAEASRPEDLDVLRGNWTDRFGKLPPAAEHLMTATDLRIRAARKGCSLLEIQEGKLKLTKNGKYLQINGKFPRLSGDNPEEWLESALDWVLDL